MIAEREGEILITAPAVLPYKDSTIEKCKACGAGLTLITRLVGRLKGGYAIVKDLAYCSGGKAPTETDASFAAAIVGRSEVRHDCAGIDYPHLHVRCTRCGYRELMRTSSEVR